MIWNPIESLDLGIIHLRFYSMTWLLAFTCGWYITKPIFAKEKESLVKLESLLIWTVLATFLGARLGHVFFYQWDYFQHHLLEILLPFRFEPEFEFTGFQGLASHGAAIGIIISMYFFSKKIMGKPILWVLDRIVIPVSCGAIFIRIGNFINSEIYGKIVAGKPFYGVKFVKEEEFWRTNNLFELTHSQTAKEGFYKLTNDPAFADILAQIPYRHPAQLYEAILYVPVFLILLYFYWKTEFSEKSGFLFGLFLILLWSIRFLIESVKESQGGFESALGMFSTGQWLSIPFILMGFFFVVTAQKPIQN